MVDNFIEKLKQDLKKITPGKWMAPGHTGVLGSGVVAAPAGTVVALGCGSDADAEFIAAAPARMEKLLAIAEAATAYSDYCDRVKKLKAVDFDLQLEGIDIVERLQASVGSLNKA